MIDKTLDNRIPRRLELAAVLTLLALGFALRLAGLGTLPFGLNQDEASAGYDAWAILTSGMDRCGNRLPVLLESWGSGQNALLSYLALPFIAVLGLSALSIRLPMALAGCAALAVFWRYARRTRGPAFGLTALLFLAVCPWSILASRWALESNLLPPLLMAGVFFTARAREKPWSLLPAAVCFGLSPYAYGTAFFFLPPFLLFAVLWLGKRLRPAPFCVSLAVFSALVLPISLCQLRNALGLPAAAFLGFTLPALTEGRQLATSVLGGGGPAAAWVNLRTLGRILLTQSDGMIYNSLGLRNGGVIWCFGLPLAALGLWKSLSSLRRAPQEAPMLAAFCIAAASAALIDGNINRLNMLWLPLCYFAALGLYVLFGLLKKWSALPIAGLLVCLVLFLAAYRGQLGGAGNANYFPGLGQCIAYVEAREPGAAYITDYVNQPYIFALFYTETPAEDFVDSVDYVNPDGAFRQVRSFGHWRFGSAEDAAGDYLILNAAEAGGRAALVQYGDYVVCPGSG